MKLASIFLVVCLASVSLAQLTPDVVVQINGPCPEPKLITDFNATAFSGLWFDQAHSKRGSGLKLKCDQTQFTLKQSSKFAFTSVAYSSATKNTISAAGEAEILENSGKFKSSMPNLNLTGEIRVLATDYSKFAILWSCSNVGNGHFQRGLVLTREKHPTVALLKAAGQILENNKIPKSDFGSSGQHKCPKYYTFASTEGTNTLGSLTSMGHLLSVNTPLVATTPAPPTTARIFG